MPANRGFGAFLNTLIAILVALGLWLCFLAFSTVRWVVYRMVSDLIWILVIAAVSIFIYCFLKIRSKRN